MRKFLVILWFGILIAAAVGVAVFGLFAGQGYLMDLYGTGPGTAITLGVFFGAFVVFVAAMIARDTR